MTFEQWYEKYYPVGLKSHSNESVKLVLEKAWEAGHAEGYETGYDEGEYQEMMRNDI